MSATANKQIIQHIHAELAKGNGRPFIDSLAEDFRWVMKGRTAWSGTYEGPPRPSSPRTTRSSSSAAAR
jgi:ketosteroid isomerase-like protein